MTEPKPTPCINRMSSLHFRASGKSSKTHTAICTKGQGCYHAMQRRSAAVSYNIDACGSMLVGAHDMLNSCSVTQYKKCTSVENTSQGGMHMYLPIVAQPESEVTLTMTPPVKASMYWSRMGVKKGLTDSKAINAPKGSDKPYITPCLLLNNDR